MANKPAHKIVTSNKDIKALDKAIDKSLMKRYKKAKSPSFALINGYYHLPSSSPFGEALVIEGYSYQTQFSLISSKSKKDSYALEPMPGKNAQALEESYNKFLDQGIVIKEISMSDALAIIKHEQSANKSKPFKLKKLLPPSVDYLISIYPSKTDYSSVLVGRVIKSDGRLLAFRVRNDNGDRLAIKYLLLSLIEDTLHRI